MLGMASFQALKMGNGLTGKLRFWQSQARIWQAALRAPRLARLGHILSCVLAQQPRFAGADPRLIFLLVLRESRA